MNGVLKKRQRGSNVNIQKQTRAKLAHKEQLCNCGQREDMKMNVQLNIHYVPQLGEAS